MADDNKTPTHSAYAFKRLSKKAGRWIEVGGGRIDKEHNIVHVVLDRLPIGGFTGYVMLYPTGATPPLPEPEPRRPGATGDADAEEASEE